MGILPVMGLCVRTRAAAAAVLLAGLVLGGASAAAETRVYLLRGWFGVFSAGMDGIAADLRGRGISAEAVGHLAWKATVARIVADRAAGRGGPLVLVGHSQGANNVIEMARELEKKRIPVDLLITLAPFNQDPVPGNVARALNFYQPGGWGAPLAGDKGFRGRISNIDVAGDLISTHVNIDKNTKVQADILREITALARSRPAR
jgi:hypothetical protein